MGEPADPAAYGDRVADLYDRWHPPDAATDRTVEHLAELAGAGPVVELGVGTGRLAIPLAARGLEVVGIEISPAMVKELRAKPGGERVRVLVGNMADAAVRGRFSLVFAAFNTFTNMLTVDDQTRCFENVAAVLSPGGAFVIEAPSEPSGGTEPGSVRALRVGTDEVTMIASTYDVATRLWRATFIVIGARGGVRLIPVEARLSTPSELDLMAEIAGLELMDRWADWEGRPFTGSSRSHVSVYRKP